MRVKWDETKRQHVLGERKIDFLQVEDLLWFPYVQDQLREDPEQHRIVGFAGGRLHTFIVEFRNDNRGEFIWVVTAWHSTKEESRRYETETR